MSNDNKQGTVRMSIVYLLLGVMFIVVFVRVVYLKTGERKEFWTKQEQKRIIKERVVSAKRGNIYAMDPDNGEYLLLATTEPQYDVYIDLGKSLEFDKESKHKVKQWVISQVISINITKTIRLFATKSSPIALKIRKVSKAR